MPIPTPFAACRRAAPVAAAAVALAGGLAPGPAQAHPHIFVEAQLGLVFDEQNRLVAVDVTWTYDEFFSLLLTADLGIDLDGDGVLTDQEVPVFEQAILDWPADFSGDLVVLSGGQPLALGARDQAEALYQDGVVIEKHRRMLATPADAPVAVQVYDQYYYVAYTVVGDVEMQGGPGCDTAYQAADLNAAYSLVEELLYGMPAEEVGTDDYFPEVGSAFADTIRVTCAGSG